MRKIIFLAALGLIATSAYASEDQAKLEEALKKEGYTSWKSIELDKGVWEVDDAIDAKGKQFDLRVDAKTLKTVSSIAE
jgi:uncharacterized membrane protein YkoI